ncbi:PTS system fructose IIA component [Anaerococcus lactolyticus ATCC 51172]|uniref:PTS system fructose IIA component n=2 Tax=Anaerococcus lactolyticus TaxID=33032 RepID=C2BHA6_9FIRM|nr:PTS system fructose IIA component [Anaerococcus lactolyticus ATCC 51172]
MAKGVKSSVELILGPQENLYAMSAYVDQDIPFEKEIKDFLSENTNEKIVILTDLLGGSVNNEILQLVANMENVILVTGMNLIMVMSVLLTTDDTIDEQIDDIIDGSKNGILRCSQVDIESDADLDDF